MGYKTSFLKLVLEKWGWVLTSSVLAASLGIASLFGLSTPAWLAWFIFFSGFLLAIWLAGQSTHTKRCELEERLKPKLEIVGVSPSGIGDDHRRILVHNLTGKTVRFGARLIEVKPRIPYQLPVDLQITHSGYKGQIEANGNQSVDVFIDFSVIPGLWNSQQLQYGLGLCFPGNPYVISKLHRWEVLVRVYPTSEEGGSDERWFYVIPQQNGSVIFTAS
jgi:hypothetical protein